MVLFSGQATDVAHKVEGLESGADEYLVKTTPVDELLARLRTIVRLQDATAALRASEEHYRRLVKSLPEAIVVVDLEGRITTTNPSAVAMLGYTQPEELSGKSLFELTLPEEQERLRTDVAAALRVGLL